MNYETIKQLAKENNMRVKDLCSLAPNNDPFYVGRPADIESAEWFENIWLNSGYSHGVHLRRIHYRVVSMKIAKPKGDIYENSDGDWYYLQTAAKNARYLDLVDMDAFIDNRNPDPYCFTDFTNPGDEGFVSPEPFAEIEPAYEDWLQNYYNGPDIPTWPRLRPLPAPGRYIANGYLSIQQDYHIEIWCEKSTMNDVFLPLCREYKLNLVTGLGEMSITAVNELMHRVEDSQRPARILYVSDYDPAGFGMPVSVGVKIAYFVSTRHPDFDIKLLPVCLTADQVSEYDLPRVPSKDSDKRKKRWNIVHGQGVVELDALEAMHPGRLEEILRREIENWYDDSLPERALHARQAYEQELDHSRSDVLEPHNDKLDECDRIHEQYAAEWAKLEAEYQAAVKPLEERAKAIQARINQLVAEHKQLSQQIETDLEQNLEDNDSLYVPDMPRPELPIEPTALYQSDRSYIEQLQVFKHYRNRTDQGVLL